MTLSISANDLLSRLCKTPEVAAKITAAEAKSIVCAELQLIQNSQHALLGKTISPRAAESTLHKLSYDGTGTIIGFHSQLTGDEIKHLEQQVIPALKDTPVRFEENKLMAPAECLINIVCLIQESELSAEDKQKITAEAKAIFLGDDIKASLKNFYKKFLQPHASSHEELLNNVRNLINNSEKVIHLTRRNENFYGRLFESKLAEKIVAAPSAEMQKITQILINTLVDDFNKQRSSAQRKICRALSNNIKNDWATWYSAIPEVADFTRHSTVRNFHALMNTASPLKPLLAVHLTVKYVVAPSGLNNIRGETFLTYSGIIQPQRYWNDVISSSQKYSSRTGIQLAWQMKGQQRSQESKGVRPLDQTRLNLEYISGHDKKAFAQEKPAAVGMSGSANLLDFLFGRLKKAHPDMNREHARLLAACCLIHSGGHSINESWTVFNRCNFTPVSYGKLIPDDAYVATALDYAWSKTIEAAASLYAQKSDTLG